MEMSPGPAWVPEACTLPTAEQPLRIAAFDQLFSDVVQGAERTAPTRLHLDLRPDPQVAGRVAELAAAETSCCSFFTFRLTVTGGSLGLDIEVPDSYVSVLDALAERRRLSARVTRDSLCLGAERVAVGGGGVVAVGGDGEVVPLQVGFGPGAGRRRGVGVGLAAEDEAQRRLVHVRDGQHDLGRLGPGRRGRAGCRPRGAAGP